MNRFSRNTDTQLMRASSSSWTANTSHPSAKITTTGSHEPSRNGGSCTSVDTGVSSLYNRSFAGSSLAAPAGNKRTEEPAATDYSAFLQPSGRAPQRVHIATPSTSSLQTPMRSVRRSPVQLAKTPRSSHFQTPRSNAPVTPSASATVRSRNNDNVVAALAHGRGFARNEVGLAAINLTACELHLCQLSDTHGFVKTMAKMNLFRPSEVLMPDTAFTHDSPSASLVQSLNRFDSDLAITSTARAAFSDARGIQYIEKLVVVDHLNVIHLVEQKYYALAATSALMSHLENELNTLFAPKTLRVYYRGTEETAVIDSETARRLELVSSLKQTGGPSLLSALDFCQTSAGSRLLRSNLLEPMTNVAVINQRLDAVEEMASRPTDLFQPIKDILSRFVDVERAVNQCIVMPKNPQASFVEQRINAVVGLKHILTLVPPLRLALSNARNPFVVALVKELSCDIYQRLLDRICLVVDDRIKAVKGKLGMQRQRFQAVKTGINQMLDVVRQTYVHLEEEIQEYVAELVEKYQMPLQLANTPARGFHLQKTLPRSKNKNDPLPDVRQCQLPPIFICAKRHGTCIAFTTQQLLVTNERIKSVQKDVDSITNTVIEELLADIRGDIGSLFKLREMICQLDVAVSFSQVCLGGGFCRPAFGDDLVIRDGRHPILNHFSPSDLISNDTKMSSECNFHVISGANMSGKSTYVRQVMLLQIMAQIGCFVPASRASFRIVDQLFSRLGTSDRLENNASSFTLEMMELNYILRNAGPKSLVILDELCKETAVDQGNAICWAICEALIIVGAWVLNATHSTLVTKLQDFYFTVANYHMGVVEEERTSGRPTLKYTHKIQEGVTQAENYGMKLARLSALPPEVLQRAQDIIPILSARVKPLPKVTIDFQMEKLNFTLHARLRDVSKRMDMLPDAVILVELARTRTYYMEELKRIVAESEGDK